MVLAGHAALLIGWKPGDFWDATPAELSVAFGAFGHATTAAEPACSSDLHTLMEQCPDG